MSTVKRIAKNSAWQLVSNIVQKIFSLIIVFILAKKFGVDNFGLYSFAFSFVAIFSVFADFGINNFVVREVSRDPKGAKRLISNALAAKIILSIFSFCGIVIAALFFGLENYKFLLVILAGSSLLIDSLAGLFRSLFYSFEIFKYETIVSFLYRLVLLFLSLAVFFFGFGLTELLLIAVASSIFNLIISIYYSAKCTILPSLTFNYSEVKKILTSSSTFLWIGLVMNIFGNADLLILQKFWGNTEVGVYSAAVRLIGSLAIVSVMFMNSVFPVATRFFEANNISFGNVVNKSLFYLSLFIFPVFVWVFVFSKDLILIFYDTDFLPAQVPLVLLAAGQIFGFANHVFLIMLLSAKREKNAFLQVLASTVLNISINYFLLIPLYGQNGAAVGWLIAQVLSFLIGFYFVSKYVAQIDLWSIYGKILFLSTVLFIYCYLTLPLLGFWISISTSVIVTWFLLNKFVLSKEDIHFFMNVPYAVKIVSLLDFSRYFSR